jgi:hypothetical protein
VAFLFGERGRDKLSPTKCKKCGSQIFDKADSCPNCGVPLKRDNKIKYLSILAILFVIGIVASNISGCQKKEETETKRIAHPKERIAEQTEWEKWAKEKEEREIKRKVDDFNASKSEILANIESLIKQKKYGLAKEEIRKYNIAELSQELSAVKRSLKENQLYEKAKKIPSNDIWENYSTYFDLVALNPEKELYKKKLNYYKAKWDEKVKLNKIERQKASTQDSKKDSYCYNLGFSYGLCATLSMYERQCDPKDNVIIPVECRNTPSNAAGIKDGVKLAYSRLGLPRK